MNEDVSPRESISIAINRLVLGRHAKSVILIGDKDTTRTHVLSALIEAAKAEPSICATQFSLSPETAFLEAFALSLFESLQGINVPSENRQALTDAQDALHGFIKVRPNLNHLLEKLQFGPSYVQGDADTGDLEYDIKGLVECLGNLAKALRKAYVLFIDGLENLQDKEWGALISALHSCSQKQLPFLIVATGEYDQVGRAGNVRSYAERMFDFVQLNRYVL